jgi:hypothetical protein
MTYPIDSIVVQQRILLFLLAIILICLFIRLFKEDYVPKPQPKPRKKRASYAWKGPKTDARINRMLAECIELMRELGVPISDSICPEVKLVGTHSYYGRCNSKGSLKRYTEFDYYIEISGHTLQNTEKSLRNTLIHELIHTVPDGLCHTGEWRKWAKYVSEKTGYNIKRLDGDETEEDYARLVGTDVAMKS